MSVKFCLASQNRRYYLHTKFIFRVRASAYCPSIDSLLWLKYSTDIDAGHNGQNLGLPKHMKDLLLGIAIYVAVMDRLAYSTSM